jgi:hypothetical protein
MAAAVQRSPPPTSPKGVVPQGPNSAARNIKASPKEQPTGGLQNASATQNVTMTQRNPTHVIRVNVLGVAGITVDRNKCNDICRKKGQPAPPKKMRAVVAVARGSQIQGTTIPSKLLARSPNDDVIVAGTAVDGDESLPVNGSRRGDDEQTQDTDWDNLHRHVAVWASEDNLSLGSLMTFDACLSTSTTVDKRGSTALVSSKYVPKSFELIVALTEDSKAYNEVALPFGVANINISGDECPQGETIVLDLPVLSLMQAKPLASNENGLASYQMIAMKPKKAESGVARKKRGALGRLFRKKNDTKSPSTPSIAERSRFTEAYSTDPSGDAILRVQLQVIKKAPSNFQRESILAMTEITPGVKALEQEKKREDDRSLDKDANTSTTQSFDASTISHDSSSWLTDESRIFPVTASRTVDSRTDDSETVGSRTVDSRTVDSRTVDSRTVDSRTLVAKMKEKEGESIVDNEAGSLVADDDLAYKQAMYSKERRGAKSQVDKFGHTLNARITKTFGQEVRFPACGALGVIDDEMTHVTADFFGKSVPIPVCSGLKFEEFDEDTNFSLRQNDTFSTLTMLLPKHKLETSFGDRATLQGTVEEDNVTKTSKSTEKGVEMRLHGPSSGTGNNKTTTAETANAFFAYISPNRDSPKGVEDFSEKDTQEEKTRSTSTKSISDRIVELFRCGPTDISRCDDAMSYKEARVPVLVTSGDASSVGDLTAITHELRIDKQRTGTAVSKRYPVACGGNGVCSSTNLVDDAAVLRGFDFQHFSSATKRSSKENYFSEYDEVSYVGHDTGPQPRKKTDSGDARVKMSFTQTR